LHETYSIGLEFTNLLTVLKSVNDFSHTENEAFYPMCYFQWLSLPGLRQEANAHMTRK
jgi:hypothetical protein